VATVSSGLASKHVATVFSSLASKLVAMVSAGLASKPVVGFLVEPQNQEGGGFPSLGLKTGSSSLVIWTSKSPQQFLGLGLKTKQALVCLLCHKTDGGRPKNFDWLPFTPLWSPSPVLQLVLEPIWSLVGFNRLCDLKVTWRKVLLSLCSSMTRISVTGKTELATIF
jgi:hypothetical protein